MRYKIRLDAIEGVYESKNELNQIEFYFENHDDLFKIIEMAKSKNIFPNEQQATEFTLGLKLFTEVILKNKDNPLFEDLKPAIGAFMQKLKKA